MAEKTMLELYLSQVEDTDLRSKLQAEFDKTTKNFGLVFERHQPEGIRMPKAPVKVGTKVIRESDKTFHRVLAVKGNTATLVDDSGEPSEHALTGLSVAREFGDVMYPGLEAISCIMQGDASDPVHTVINGENYHALEMLQYTHSKSVDLIYIDPPYNTGNKTWKYNDRYVGEQDAYKHSKWLSFMEKRLRLAKALLKPTGILIMAIDDNEHARLKVLTDDVFGEQNFLANITWQGLVKNNARFSGGGVDYMLIYASSKEALVATDTRWTERKPGIDLALDAGARAWVEADNDPILATKLYRAELRKLKPQLEPAVFRYDSIDDRGDVFRSVSMAAPEDRPNRSRHVLFHPTTGKPCAVPSSGWNCSTETLLRREANGEVVFGRDETVIPTSKSLLSEMDIQVPYPTFSQGRMPGSKHLQGVLGDDRFPNPKDYTVISRWVRMTAPKDAVILDFFGGSGTTAEAVMRLNAEDGGTRQCILVTNNELSAKDDTKLRKAGLAPGDDEYESLGVFRHVTKPRIETVVTGVREDGSSYSKGLAANVVFFDLAYLDAARIRSGQEFDSLTGVFWLRAGGIGPLVRRASLKQGFAICKESKLAVLFKPSKASQLAQLLAEEEHPNLTHLFIVTESDEQGDEARSYFASHLTVERIYGSYLSAFQVNKKG